MKPTRKTWVSAGVVAVILTGGASVTAAASAAGIGGTGDPAPAVEPGLPAPEGAAPPSPTVPPAAPEPTAPAEDYVVSTEVGPDPEKVARYWTEQRLDAAQPMPMPVVEGPADVSGDGPVGAGEGPVDATE
ncbi:hypothetical protein GCM10010466_49320 [Planomonospora alba]|uniref:Uncharacterized protein n=1 Tax=Planomonospora alba TaxID=161354 RepID=A0ABP6NMR0_9ACTN